MNPGGPEVGCYSLNRRCSTQAGLLCVCPQMVVLVWKIKETVESGLAGGSRSLEKILRVS